MRAISLKSHNNQELTDAEQEILQFLIKEEFCLPEPIYGQVMNIGNIVTPMDHHLYPEFLPLPDFSYDNVGGYYGDPEQDEEVHNLYEELPCLGVVCEAVMHSVSNEPPGLYESRIVYHDQQPNHNFLGFRSLGYKRAEAKNLALECDITFQSFPSEPADTGFNIRFLRSISNY